MPRPPPVRTGATRGHPSPESGDGATPAGRAVLRDPRPDIDRFPAADRPPRLLASLSLPYLAELAGDDMARVLRPRAQPGHRRLPDLRVPPPDEGAAGPRPAAPPLRPELRWRHALSAGGTRRSLVLLLAALAVLALLAVLLLLYFAAPEADEAPETAMAMIWEGPAVIGPERDAPPDPASAALPDSPPDPVIAAPEPLPETDATPRPDPAPEPEARPEPQPEPRAETTPPDTAMPEPPEPEVAALPEVGAAARPPAPSATTDLDGDVPLPRQRPAALVGDVVMPRPARELPQRPSLPDRPVDMAGARPSDRQQGKDVSRQAPVQQIALQVYASDGPAPQRIQGYPLPAYPVRARLLSLEGTVTLNVKIGQQGGQGHVWVEQSSGHPELDSAAYDAILQWRFAPPTYRDEKVVAIIEIPVSFTLRRPDRGAAR